MVETCHPRVSFAQKFLQFLVQSFIGDPASKQYYLSFSWIPDEAAYPKTEVVFGGSYLGNDKIESAVLV
jgi:hypothetical protein